ncbi:MAG: biotin transporter BioY [Clostridia bacterium]|nr:biotin transporter BioY [Clostridia bacterium]
MNRSRISPKNIAYVALGTALIALSALISLPFAIPFTLQTFGVFAVLLVLGGNRGVCAVAVYILLGLIGLPIFSGFQSGLSAVLGATGGFIIGFAIAALIFWLFEALFGKRTSSRIAAVIIGMIACYCVGSVWYFFYIGESGFQGFVAALSVCVVPYLIPDALKICAAFWVARAVSKAIKA